MTKRPNDALIETAILTSFQTGLDEAASRFGLTVADLTDYRAQFLERHYAALHPPPAAEISTLTEPKPVPGWLLFWGNVRQNWLFTLAFKLVLAVGLLAICYASPYALQRVFDPITNTIVWVCFTSALLLVVGGVVIDLVLFVQQPAVFEFLNPLAGATTNNDYYTLLYSDQLTAYEKCRLVQRISLSYLAAWCACLLVLAVLTHG